MPYCGGSIKVSKGITIDEVETLDTESRTCSPENNDHWKGYCVITVYDDIAQQTTKIAE